MCCHGHREHFFFVLNKLPGSWNRAKWLFIINMKFPIYKYHRLIFDFWDFGRIMAVGHWAWSQNRDFRVFSSSPWNFWSREHDHALYWNFGTLAGLGSTTQAQMTIGPLQKIFLVLRPIKNQPKPKPTYYWNYTHVWFL
jgi:hypothetical protein